MLSSSIGDWLLDKECMKVLLKMCRLNKKLLLEITILLKVIQLYKLVKSKKVLLVSEPRLAEEGKIL